MTDRLVEPQPAIPMVPLRRLNIRDDVYVLLRSGILNHNYPPGRRLDLEYLSNQLQVSRTPVKEALHRLESEGLVQILPRRGTFVTALDPVTISESYDVRIALEQFVAGAAAQNATPADVQALRDIQRQMQHELAAPDFSVAVERYIRLDQDFHTLIVGLGKNARLLEVYRTIGGPLQLARILNKFDAGDYLAYTEPEHSAIISAVASRDSKALKRALTQHVEFAKGRVMVRLGRLATKGQDK